MEIEILRLLEDSAKDVVIGINAMIATVPRDVGDTQPPNVATILCSANDPELARGRLPEPSDTIVYPLVGITVAEDPTVEMASTDTYVPCSIRIVIVYGAVNSDTQNGTEHARYTNRAIRKWIRRLLLNDNAAARTRNSIEFVTIDKSTILRTANLEADKRVIAGLDLTCTVHDNAP